VCWLSNPFDAGWSLFGECRAERILHAPGECEFCDLHPEWQALRVAWGIAFTGWTPDENELPCPANHARGEDCEVWHGNRPKLLNLGTDHDGTESWDEIVAKAKSNSDWKFKPKESRQH
jgi:hypothetical protein